MRPKEPQRLPDIKHPLTGEQLQLSKRDLYWWRKDKAYFYRRLRRKLGLPEPEKLPSRSEFVFYWDDGDPRRMRAFLPKRRA